MCLCGIFSLLEMAEQMDLGIAEDEEGANALHLAAHSGCLDCCKFLVEEAWIDVNSTTTKGAFSASLVLCMVNGSLAKSLFEMCSLFLLQVRHRWFALCSRGMSRL
jgi:ankyrin repeat protein